MGFLRRFRALVLLHFANAASVNLSTQQADPVCGLLAAIPFGDGRPVNGAVGLSNGTTVFKLQNLARAGYGLMAAALMAMDHFNSRNDSIVSELDTIRNCTFQFPVNLLHVLDSNRSPSSTFKGLLRVQNPCFVIGPLDDNAAGIMQLALSSENIPGITYGARSPSVANGAAFPQMVRGTIELIQYAAAVSSYLQRSGKERNYAVSLVNGGAGFELANALQVSATPFGLNVVQQLNMDPQAQPAQALSAPLQAIQDSGVRTIIVGLIRDDDLELLANDADDLGMLSDEYFWVFLDQTLPPEYIYEYQLQVGSPLARLLQGSAIVKLLDGFEWNSEDRFLPAWRSLNGSFVEGLNKLYPNTSAVQFRADSDFFQKQQPPTDSTFVYDAVISAGMGQCLAMTTGPKPPPPSGQGPGQRGPPNDLTMAWVQSILKTSFYGASGHVAYNESQSREPTSLGVGVFNILPNGLNASTSEVQFKAVLTDVLLEEEWRTTGEPFIFRDGTSNQPTPTRVITINNYLPTSIRATGLSLMAVAQVLTLACGVFVWVHRKQRVLTASQPEFLYVLCVGSFLFSSSILTRSFDEGLGLSQTQLDAFCMITPWLLFVGDSVIYMALFSKLWRVQKVLQFRRGQKISIKHVIGPFIFCEISVLAVMTTWQILSPWHWTRVTIEGIPPQTVGRCWSEHEAAYMGSLAGIIFAITLLVAWMSWKTRDAPAEISDSSRVWYTILTHLQSIIVGVPVLYILNGKSPNALFLCFALLVSTISITSMSFLIVPKMYILWEKCARGDNAQCRTVHITGFGGAARLSMSHTTGDVESQLKGLEEKIRLLEVQRQHLRTSVQNQSNGEQQVHLVPCRTTSLSGDEGASNPSNSSSRELAMEVEGVNDSSNTENVKPESCPT